MVKQINKQSRVDEALEKVEKQTQSLMKKTKRDDDAAAEAIAELDLEILQKTNDPLAEKPLFKALHGVMIVLQKPKDWVSIKKEVRNPKQFIDQLKNVDKKNIPKEVI